MPSTRRLKVGGLIIVLTVLIIVYISSGASNTRNSPFYTRTLEAIKVRHDTNVRQKIFAEEKERMDRVQRLEKEHDQAVSAAAVAAGASAAGAVLESGPLSSSEKPVAGRKMMKDGRIVETSSQGAGDDGVAKVGNIGSKVSDLENNDASAQTEEERAVEAELNGILKRGPIIIFSKSYCPFSKKAKHILLDEYTITPRPYVVELDQHELGQGLQSALHKSTGRRTVPNVLINGKSIGGGDDIERLHHESKLIETIKSMGGKRVVNVERGSAN